MDLGWQWADLAIVFATLIGPVLAVQAQKYLERRRETRDRQVSIFRTLMMSRGATLSPTHVQAINAIPIEFYGNTPKLKAIVNTWKLYVDHHSFSPPPPDGWESKRADIFIELMTKIASYLNYDFSSLEIKKDIYHPNIFVRQEYENESIRNGLFSIFKGEFNIPLEIKSMPHDPVSAARVEELHTELLNWLRRNETLNTSSKEDRARTHKPEAS